MANTLLAVEKLAVAYGGARVLVDVSLRVMPREAVGIIGPNGSGKTTLLNCVGGACRQRSGTIRYCEQPIDWMSPNRRARVGIRRTFQNLALFEGMSAFDNIRIGADHPTNGANNPDSSQDIAERLVEEVGLQPFALAPVRSLSMGYRRRVEIARALAGQPKLLLLDEPTSGIAPSDAVKIVELLGQLRKDRGFAVLMVEHQLDAVAVLSDRIVALDSGLVVAEGEATAVLDDEAVRASYLGPPL